MVWSIKTCIFKETYEGPFLRCIKGIEDKHKHEKGRIWTCHLECPQKVTKCEPHVPHLLLP